MPYPLVDIRPWAASDARVLHAMILDCLRVNHEAGAHMLPTEKNAEVLVAVGLRASERGDPCLLASLDEPVGYTLWCELPNPLGLEFEDRLLHGLGTYVRPSHRRRHIATALRDAAEAQAARMGFGRVIGVAYHEAGLESLRSRSWQVYARELEKELRC